MDMKLEVIMLPVSDVDRAKEFYKKLGFREDIDVDKGEAFRFVQYTPPGSAASIFVGKGITTTEPGSVQGLVLVVDDIEATHAELVGKGVDAKGIFHDADGLFYHAHKNANEHGAQPDHQSYQSFTAFTDPDGNGWIVQEVKERLPGRV
jgi:catechol 2,3-dioxygenase-like lactoylglutathione lyase family enzyme